MATLALAWVAQNPWRRGPAYISFFFFFFNDTATTEIYTLSLHDALPISRQNDDVRRGVPALDVGPRTEPRDADRKSTRLNSSHLVISYAVFCLKKKKQRTPRTMR